MSEGQDQVTNFVEYELAEDMKEFVRNSDGIDCDKSIREDILGFDDGTLLQVTKSINSPIKILAVQEATSEVISSSF